MYVRASECCSSVTVSGGCSGRSLDDAVPCTAAAAALTWLNLLVDRLLHGRQRRRFTRGVRVHVCTRPGGAGVDEHEVLDFARGGGGHRRRGAQRHHQQDRQRHQTRAQHEEGGGRVRRARASLRVVSSVWSVLQCGPPLSSVRFGRSDVARKLRATSGLRARLRVTHSARPTSTEDIDGERDITEVKSGEKKRKW